MLSSWLRSLASRDAELLQEPAPGRRGLYLGFVAGILTGCTFQIEVLCDGAVSQKDEQATVETSVSEDAQAP